MFGNTIFGTILLFAAIYLVACKFLELIGYIDLSEQPQLKEKTHPTSTSKKTRSNQTEKCYTIFEGKVKIDKVFGENELQQALLHYELQNKDVTYKEI